ncbi:MAG TPA: hypothetical protein VL688_06850 [Verrucomicrobiae bacterium]|nr:hypothetical protein [Verrucomicrobiae bacterium]
MPDRKRKEAAASYKAQFEKMRGLLEKNALRMKQDKKLHEAVTHYQVQKSLERIAEADKLLAAAAAALAGREAPPGRKHKLIMPRQGDLL